MATGAQPSPYKFPLTPQQIAAAVHCPEAAVEAQWPLVEGCLADMALISENVCIASIATIAVETAWKFKPIDEYGGPEYWHKMYDIEGERPEVARRLGNLTPGDGVKFHGRGLIQTTGKINYERGKVMVGVDIVTDPDKAKEPHTAAALFAAFFYDHHEAAAAAAGDWPRVRKIVNGGANGLTDFLRCVTQLQNALQANK